MKKRTLLLAAILVVLSIITTLIYRYTQQANVNYYQARRHFIEGKYNKAIPLYEKVLTFDPFHVDALKDLAHSYQRTGKYEKAIDTFQKVLSHKPQEIEIKKSLAKTYSWNKEYGKAISLYKEVIAATDDIEVDSKARLLLAKALHYSGEAEKAIVIYKDLLGEKVEEEGTPERKKIIELLSEAYMIGKDYESAATQYREILKEDPANAKARNALADILSWEKEYAESIREYEKLLEIQPDNPEVRGKLAKVYTWNKDYKKAEDLYKDIIEKNPHNSDACASLGEILMWDKRYTEALYYINLGLSKKEDENLRFLYGQVFLLSGDYERAKEILNNVIASTPNNLKAREYLADAFAYSREFDKAISLYREIVKQEGSLDVKIKLADALSWDKKYAHALDLYDEILNEKKETRIWLQKARILGWARKYNESIEEYQRILDTRHSKPVELEMKAKKAYWNNRVKTAIYYYRELIEKDPTNVEAMFDLSQIYSYQSMWKEATEEYERIIGVSPTHFRAKEALQKVELISEHLSLKTGYEFFEADSQDRITDIRRHTFFGKLTYQVNPDFRIGGDYNRTRRSFSDFADVLENEGRIKFIYTRNPHWWADSFYDFIVYDKDIDTMHNFGGSLNLRVFDTGVTCFSYERERLENSSTVIRDNYYSDNFAAQLDLDITKRFEIGLDYLFSSFSDDNYKIEPGFDVLYYLSVDPKRFLVRYRYLYTDFDEEVQEYFSPRSFSTHTVTLSWRHFLNKEEIFWGADDLYYDITYDISADSEDIVTHKFSGEIYWDISKRLGLSIKGTIADSSDDVYEEKSVVASVKYYF